MAAFRVKSERRVFVRGRRGLKALLHGTIIIIIQLDANTITSFIILSLLFVCKRKGTRYVVVEADATGILTIEITTIASRPPEKSSNANSLETRLSHTRTLRARFALGYVELIRTRNIPMAIDALLATKKVFFSRR